MSANRDGSPLVDIVAITVSPAFIMLMVGSLVWFLVDVLYSGNYPDRLLWCLSFFVFGAVLIARITIEQGYAYASAYALALGAATFLAMIRYVEYKNNRVEAIGWAISLGLMGFVWWMANKLTWDCTNFEVDRRASGRGLVTATGLDSSATSEPDSSDSDDVDPEEAAKPRKKDSPGLMGWMERFWRYRDANNKRPHTPGTWVLYIGLAALPIFALGQSLISPDDLTRRRTTLMEAAIFVGSALGLLVTTSLMGLRRYLEQRNARVPVAMTLGWLSLGGILIVAFVAVAMFLPRPHSETPWFGLDRTGEKSERNASKYAAIRDKSAGQGDGATGEKQEPGGKQPGDKQPGGKQPGDKQPGGKDPVSDASQKRSDNTQPGGKQSDQKQPGGKQPGEKPPPDKQPGGKQPDQKQPPEKQPVSDASQKRSDGENPEKSESKSNPWRGEEPKSESKSTTSEKLNEVLNTAGSLVKWIIWALIALAIVAGIVFFVLRGLAPFTSWAKNLLEWFRNLFTRRSSADAASEEAESAPPGPKRPPPFTSFSNPFTDGTAKRRTPAELATYTFAALDAWAWDRDHGRELGETPSEFAARLGEAFPNVDAPAQRAADVLIRAMYSKGKLSPDAMKPLAALWKILEQSAVPMRDV